MRVLIIEDNRDLAANLADYLEARGHVPDCAGDGVTGLHLAVTTRPDAIVLDLGLPGMDGMALCQRLREARQDTPVIMLTARGELDDRVQGLGTGADDYLVKPVALKELEARLLAQVRRATGGLTRTPLQVGDLILDEDTRRVSRGGRTITLARLDFELLRVLMRASPAVVPRHDLEQQAWHDQPPTADTMRAHIHRLRRAIDHGTARPLLHTVHGVGYRLAADDHDAPA
ncbi:response regulator transcription factor [Aquisalimonas asiatica]|uniref:DNA-binding response regulator, OmpR family, contains REC and winged-helix (WHTH) domain n=1 Tax=Aquisalimonas asiatica TaxID=406100 RepID=A0A1H8QNL1_9GAMM|nr:response regulator transcription factor [Aquisalimonas asiatica]SEO55799.1 DNA-binding response regulator, OmpR family, contains REC and winged-helix (wHTH) domain [Aquisalimonas asiatica]